MFSLKKKKERKKRQKSLGKEYKPAFLRTISKLPGLRKRPSQRLESTVSDCQGALAPSSQMSDTSWVRDTKLKH